MAEKVLIIGTGPAGLTAAIYVARAGYQPLVFAGLQHGGQLTTTTDVENFPGFRDGIMGPKLMEEMTEQAQRVGAEVIRRTVTRVDLSERPFTADCDGQTYTGAAMIIATGATAKLLGLPGEERLMGRGLSTCATCDGFFYRGKTVAVVGGGDSAMEEAGYLAKLCKEVVLVHRRDGFRASRIMAERTLALPNVIRKIPYVPVGLLSDDSGVTGLKLQHGSSGEEEDLTVDGVFYAIGHRPNSEVFKPFLKTDDNGYLLTENAVNTSVPGVFAAGDIADHEFRQAITAAGLGCQAAIRANRFIEGHPL